MLLVLNTINTNFFDVIDELKLNYLIENENHDGIFLVPLVEVRAFVKHLVNSA